MKPLILLVGVLLLSSAASAAPAPVAPTAQADWRREGVDGRVKDGLTSQGWRFEEDGRALDPKTKAPAAKGVLDKAVLDMRQDARRAALETINLMLDPNRPAEPGDRQRLETLAVDLPPGLAAAVLDPKSDLAKTRSMASAGLAEVAAYFDGGRTLEDRMAAARPVSAGPSGPRVDLPYYTAAEKAAGEKLQAAARAEIGRDPFGRTVLARLDAMPPILIEEQSAGVAAHYDYRRRAVVLDRESVVASVAGTVPPRQAGALRASLSTRAALAAYLEAHPEAAAAVAKDHDVVLVHELTHAWQDRRDPIFREMARGSIPDLQPLEYEEEAYKTKNLYLRSKLKNDPASVRMDDDLDDYMTMTRAPDAWKDAKFDALKDASPSRAVTVRSAREIENARVETVRARPVATSDEQRSKALDLQALTRGGRQLQELEAAHIKRMSAMDPSIREGTLGAYKDLGQYYLGQALTAARAPDRATFLDRAEVYAKASGSEALIEKVREAKGRHE